MIPCLLAVIEATDKYLSIFWNLVCNNARIAVYLDE